MFENARPMIRVIRENLALVDFMKTYNPKSIEKKWQKEWEEVGVYTTEDASSKPKFYILDMFPYPSGEALHVGHPKGYIASDIVARYKHMKGFNVLHPMGWDAFGLPAENYAIKHKTNPNIAVKQNVKKFKKQLSLIGFNYDWNREINTTDPKYYKWTQWIFLQLFKKGLAYESNEPINWCPSCKTGLANEDLENGKCERCGSDVEKRPMRQWMLKITDYADRLLEDLDTLHWPESVKEMQRNWIGRSEGINITYQIDGLDISIIVFTTRPDTNFGATFLVAAPDSKFVSEHINRFPNKSQIEAYVNENKNKSEIDRLAEGKKKTGVFTGLYAMNQLNNKKLPIYIGDFVLGNVGTGVVVGVPGHDLRDFEFAQAMGVEVVRVVVGPDGDTSPITRVDQVQEEAGTMVNSGFLDGLDIHTATKRIMDYLVEKGWGQRVVNYKLRDWVFSRQRYWGEPIPIVHCKKCGAVAVPEDQLPVTLPNVRSYEPTGTGESPLANIKKWVNTKCPQCGGRAKRETNTMPQWAGSSWYYLRYLDPTNSQAMVDKGKEKYWMPVDLYVGGVEHATRHLIYARFWHKFLFDHGFVSTCEPFIQLRNQGMIIAPDGRRMSKRWGNIINPDDVIAEYGADTFRLYEMFMGPFENAIAWSTESMIGVRRFLDRVWKMTQVKSQHTSSEVRRRGGKSKVKSTEEEMRPLVHQTIKRITDDIENFRFNTCVSQLMILINDFEKNSPSKQEIGMLLKILSPFAPHMTEELWHQLQSHNPPQPSLTLREGEKESPPLKIRGVRGSSDSSFIVNEPWPMFDVSKLQEEAVTIAVQFNGKMRGTVMATGSAEAEVKEAAMNDEKLKKHFSGETKKIIFVKDKIINFVI